MDELSNHYASALFSLLSTKERPVYATALKEIQNDLREQPDFLRLLSSYALPKEEKEALLDKVYAKPYEELPHLLPFLKVISAHHRFTKFKGIVMAYCSFVNEEAGIKEGVAFSAEKLKPDDLAALEKTLEKRLGCKVSLRNIVDHSLLGGVKVNIDDKVYDGSLRHRLVELRHTLKGGSLS